MQECLFISEADPIQLDPSKCHSVMEQEQRDLDEVSVGAHSVSEVGGDVPSGRFATLASERGDESPVVHACRAPSDVVRRRGSTGHSCCLCAEEVAVNFKEVASHVRSHHSPRCPRERFVMHWSSICQIVERAEFARGWAPGATTSVPTRPCSFR